MGAVLNSRLGKVNLLASNPRTIRDSAFNALCESIERDEAFMRMRGVIVWQVPTSFPGEMGVGEGEGVDNADKNPFSGQRGKLVVLCGNMRCLALKALGYKELRDEWLIEAKHEDGSWISAEEAARLVLIDNETPGMSGMNDYEKMLREFKEITMREAGIDFSEFQGLIDAGKVEVPLNGMDEEGKDEVDRIEEGENGEKNEELEAFIAEREKTRRDLKEIDEVGFHMLLVFPDGFEEKAEFIEKAKLFKGAVAVGAGPYLDLVFETYGQKMEFAEKAGLLDADPETGLVPLMYGMFCDGRSLAEKMGITLKASGLKFRDRVLDHQLEGMAMESGKQKTREEIEEEIYARLKAERRELGMSVGRGSVKKGKWKGKWKAETSEYPTEEAPVEAYD